MHTGTEPGATETYVMPSFGSTPHATFVPPSGGIEYMGGGLTPQYVFDPGLGYPAANNYGYYCTGFEAPGEWGDHHRVFGLDGRDLHYSDLQTESLPYVYYPPSYGYAQTPINQYSPFIPGAVVGLDGPFIGSQPHFNSLSYQPPFSSPTYIPVFALQNSDVVANNSADPLPFNTGAPPGSRPAYTGTQYKGRQAPVNAAAFSQRAASGSIGPASVNAVASSQTAASGSAAPASQPSQSTRESQTAAKILEGSQISASTNNQSSCQEAMMNGDVTQDENSTGSRQATDDFPHVRVPFIQNPTTVAAPSNSGFTNFGSNSRSWATAESYRPKFQFNGVANDGKGSPDSLAEQNRGPRTNRSKGERTSSGADGADETNASTSNASANIVINADQYNRDDFPVDYPDSKFFVIKSYSEDDVHKSIKYSVWSSTPNGNKRLHSAYEDAQKISAGKPRKCPVFLFFSVNASGQFCGVAEMVGPVDFQKDMNFWQQDKWSGSFPVKWHIIKDVANASLRHIILENNENKPVTNSRDTQEIPYKSGLNMLNVFKSSPLRTSILDDFVFYEERQKKMLEEKCRVDGKNFDTSLSSLYVPAFVPKTTVNPPLKADQKQSSGNNQCSGPLKEQSSGTSDLPQSPNEEQPDDAVDQSPKLNGKQSAGAVNLPSEAEGKRLSSAGDQPPLVDGKRAIRTLHQSPEPDGKQLATTVNQPAESSVTEHHSKPDRKQPSGIHQPLKADGKQGRVKVDQPLKSDVNVHGTKDGKILSKARSSSEMAILNLDESKDFVPASEGNKKNMTAVLRIESLSIKPKDDVAENSGSRESEEDGPDVVQVGSLRIKVKGFGEPSSKIINVGTEPFGCKGSRPDKQVTEMDSHPRKN